jgi:1-acyl-sn-glycerol-3-phosphate acyltransferase
VAAEILRSHRRAAVQNDPLHAELPGRDFAIWDRAILPFARRLLRSGYFSLEVEGAERVRLDPADSVVYVANHSGWYSFDTLFIAFTIHEWLGRQVVPYTVTADAQLRIPWVGPTIARVGGVAASLFKDPRSCPAEIRHVGMFAEGAAGNGKPFWRAYRLERFRTGFVRFALIRRATVVPMAVIGGEECAPVAWTWRSRDPASGARLSVPLSLVPLPSRWKIIFLDPILFPHAPDEADDPALCGRLASSVRERMQAVLDAETRDRPLARLARSIGAARR